MLQAVQQASLSQRDPARMLRVLALLAAPVYNPRSPDQYPTPLNCARSGMFWLMAYAGAVLPSSWPASPCRRWTRCAMLSPPVPGSKVSSRMSSTSAAMPGERVCSWRTSSARCTLPLPRKF
jgi:hypothetical protein